MRRLVMALWVCLGACGDNQLPAPDAMSVAPFQPAPHVPMPLAIPHAGAVLSNLHLVTITYQDYTDAAQVEAFGDMLVGSTWYTSVGAEYGVHAGTHAQKYRLDQAPASLTRDLIGAQIKRLITDGSVLQPPATGNQLVYLIYIPPTVARDAGLAGIRGYHDVLTLDTLPMFGGVQVPIAVVLDDGRGLPATTRTAAHQVIDAVTDPYHPPMDGYYADPPDWKLSTQVSDHSELTLDDMSPRFSSDMINNGVSVTLTLHAPANATTGTAGGVYVLSGENVRPWAVGFLVE